MIKLNSRFLVIFCLLVSHLEGVERLKDFRSTEQKLALLGFKTETVEADIEKKYTEEFRKEINRYSKSYGTSSISAFSLPDSSKGKYFAPVGGALSEDQRKFLVKAAKDNSIDIIVLGSLSQQGLKVDAELQLYDARIDTLSGIEKASLLVTEEKKELDQLVYKLMNYMDRDGFVHQTSQDILLAPVAAVSSSQKVSNGNQSDDYSINPTALSGGLLAGEVNIGGDKRPYWETWWFWGLIGGGLIAASGLSYYFLVVNQPPNTSKIEFRIP
jgi:hypothetical protein